VRERQLKGSGQENTSGNKILTGIQILKSYNCRTWSRENWSNLEYFFHRKPEIWRDFRNL